MKFFSKFALVYAVTALALTAGYYFAATKVSEEISQWLFFVYFVLVFATAFLFSFIEKGNSYSGFNYHLISYIIANGLPIGLAFAGIVPKEAIGSILFVMACWGVGLLFHFLMYFFMVRKKQIRNYEKDDVFR